MGRDSQPVPSPDGYGEQLKLMLSIEEAARALSVSRDSFERYVIARAAPWSAVGRRLRDPVRELERWVEHAAAARR